MWDWALGRRRAEERETRGILKNVRAILRDKNAGRISHLEFDIACDVQSEKQAVSQFVSKRGKFFNRMKSNHIASPPLRQGLLGNGL